MCFSSAASFSDSVLGAVGMDALRVSRSGTEQPRGDVPQTLTAQRMLYSARCVFTAVLGLIVWVRATYEAPRTRV